MLTCINLVCLADRWRKVFWNTLFGDLPGCVAFNGVGSVFPPVAWLSLTGLRTLPAACHTFLAHVAQENLWRPIVKEPITHEDGTVTVVYEVPCGHNECLERSKRISPAVGGRFNRDISKVDEVQQLLTKSSSDPA